MDFKDRNKVIEKMKVKKQNIKYHIIKENYNEAYELAEKYYEMYEYDFDAITIFCELKIQLGKFDEAQKFLLGVYKKYEYNFDVNALLGIANFYLKEYFVSAKYFVKAILINENRVSEFQEIFRILISKYVSKEDKDLILEEAIEVMKNNDKNYPNEYKSNFLCEINKSYILADDSYYKGIYDYYYTERDELYEEISNDISNLVKTELIPGKLVDKFEEEFKEDCVLPIMSCERKQNIKVNYINKEFRLCDQIKNRFYYYPLNKGDSIKIESNSNYIVGEPIQLKVDKSKPKLILNIFIDGLSQKYIESNDLQNLMPNTYEYFSKGTKFNNTYVGGEWTYVSLASFFTGLYTSKHRVFHPDYATNNIKDIKIYSEVFKENGYNTAKIDGDWRSNPAMGYAKGFNRYLYQPSIRGMHADEVINETIEHIEAFKNTNNFLWICIPDLHDIADEFETRLSTQVKSSFNIRPLYKNTETSVHKKYDENKIERYKIQLKRIDRYLKVLYNYINENYSDEEIIISLVSDHGQGYFIKEGEEMLEEERIKVPLMLKGKNIPSGECNEFVQSFDLFPIILNLIGVDDLEDRQGIVPKYFGGNIGREYTISETIFPDTPYKATINDEKHKFFFETEGKCSDDGLFEMGEYKVKLIDKLTYKDESDIYVEKVDIYTEVILEHIKEFIIY